MQPSQSKIQNPKSKIPEALDFPGRNTVTPPEIAARLGTTPLHIRNLIESHVIAHIDISSDPDARPCYRVPIEAYRDFIRSRYKNHKPKNP